MYLFRKKRQVITHKVIHSDYILVPFPLFSVLRNSTIGSMQVVSDFDIFSIVGANKPLQLVDIGVSVKEEGTVVVRFEGISGSPAVSGICIRRASRVLSGTATFSFLFNLSFGNTSMLYVHICTLMFILPANWIQFHRLHMNFLNVTTVLLR